MRLIDLSQPVFDDCPNCPGHPPVKSEVVLQHADHDWHMELLTLASHSGSHIDAPLHRIPNGASLDQIPLDRFVGQAWIADLRDSEPEQPITEARIEKAMSHARGIRDRIVLLATGWGQKRSKDDLWLNRAPHLDPSGTKWLAERGIVGVGIDHYTVGDATVHEMLLSRGIWIAEELKFPDEVFSLPQPVQFWALPVNLQGHSGAFCRPVIVVDEQQGI